MFQYEKLSSEIEAKISDGTYSAGEKLPSVRSLSQSLDLSITTVLEAYRRLEDRGIIQAKPKSGFFVQPPQAGLPDQKGSDKLEPPQEIPFAGLMQTLLAETGGADIIRLGLAQPEPDLLPQQDLNRILRRVLRTPSFRTSDYVDPKGLQAFRAKIAGLMVARGVNVSANDILVTNGCQQALRITLACVAQKGDVIAMENPCYPGMLHVASELGARVIEVPSRAGSGIDLALLAKALDTHDIKAIFLNPTSANPNGSTIPIENRAAIVELANRHETFILEDDTNRDLFFGDTPPPSLKSFDENGRVIYCGSLSKTMGPGLRLGWMLPGHFMEQALANRYTDDLGGPSLEQFVLAEFLGTGGYHKALERARRIHAQTVVRMVNAIRRHFPEGTHVNIPSGGFLLWVKLPWNLKGDDFRKAALQKNISIAPGAIFSGNRPADGFVRIGWGGKWDDAIEGAIATLGKIAGEMA